MKLSLYQRDDCHLCDAAIDVLAQAGAPDFGSVWIDGDSKLEACYAARVPVLRDEHSGAELNWPFDAIGLRAFLSVSAEG